jgi:lipopolysaccharide transport system ATP-binding protein
MTDAVIRVESISKRYHVGERERYLALRDVIANAVKLRSRRKQPKDFVWAVRDVSFEVKRGEVVGLIGRNGAGKTTLLKLLARITQPTSGCAELYGRIGSLLEVGTGFHPELTGRENIFLSGAILGMSKAEIRRKYDEIVAFAEVERFIDTPLKHYSTGMQVRLAFAVAAHLEPEILLVDEVLAVGDLAFQKKCLGRMQEVSESGRTIVFVSHQMNQIRRLCERVIWLDAGEIRQSGATAAVLGAYETEMMSGNLETVQRASATETRFLRWEIAQAPASQLHVLSTLGPVEVCFYLRVSEPVRFGHQGTALFSPDNQLIWAAGIDSLKFDPGDYALYYKLPTLPLRPGTYRWLVTLYDEGSLVDSWNCTPEMLVATKPVTHPRDEWTGILNIPYQFTIDERKETRRAHGS